MSATSWVDVCSFDDLVPDRGACALVDGQQIALFRVSFDGEVFALSNRDPFSDAFVLSRGIVGSRKGVAKVASPIYKQNFDLRTGVCLDDAAVQVPVYPCRVLAGRVEIGLP
jgi:nitrite reductase (NADH) small subunit